MRRWIYDTEVSAFDNLAVFKCDGHYEVFHNDPEGLQEFIYDSDDVYIGFNSKAYDQFIIKAILMGKTVEEVKELSDYLIADHNGWQHPWMQETYICFNNVDIRDDMQVGLSLKAIEGHLGMDIEETEVDFNLNRPWTPEERDLMIKYCKHDVDATEKIVELRKGYLDNKVQIGKMAGLSVEKSLSMTNAKLTAALLKASKKPHDDEREYVIPDNLKREYIPQEVLDFFNRIHDKSIPDEELFSSKLEFNIGECPIVMGFGGIHGAIPNFIWREGEE